MDEQSRVSNYDMIRDVIKPRSKIRKFMVWNFKSRDQLSLSWQWWKKKRLQVSDHHFWRFSTHENFPFGHFYSKFIHFLETVPLKKIKIWWKFAFFETSRFFFWVQKYRRAKIFLNAILREMIGVSSRIFSMGIFRFEKIMEKRLRH